MINREITKYVADWFARADEDLDIAKLILDEERPYNPACFHAQQAAEKYLKGFLAHHEKHVRKIHDLEALLQECIKIDQSFENLQDNARYLTRFYVESRYPDDYIEFTREDAEKGLEAAIRIKEFVLEKIKSQKAGFGIVGIILVIAAIVVLGGFFGYQYLKLQKIQEKATMPAAEPSAPPPVSTETRPRTNEIDISTWKTYRNEQYGFEVRYPKNAEIEVQENITFFRVLFRDGPMGESIRVEEARQIGIDDWISKNIQSSYVREKAVEIAISGERGKRMPVVGDITDNVFVVTKRGSYIYSIASAPTGILSTFKFIK